MFFRDSGGDKAAIRSEHISSQLSIKGNVAPTGRNKKFLNRVANGFSDYVNIVFRLVRSVRYADSAG